MAQSGSAGFLLTDICPPLLDKIVRLFDIRHLFLPTKKPAVLWPRAWKPLCVLLYQVQELHVENHGRIGRNRRTTARPCQFAGDYEESSAAYLHRANPFGPALDHL